MAKALRAPRVYCRPDYDPVERRKDYLPQQLQDTRAKLRGLVLEAKRYGMIDILTMDERLNIK